MLALVSLLVVADPHPVSAALDALRAQASAPRTPAACAPLESAVMASLQQAQLVAERLYPCMLQVKGPVKSVPEKLEKAGVRMLFDAGWLIEHPYAKATFDRAERLVRVPESYVISPNSDDPVLRHELVHVALWAAAQKDPKTKLAYLRGPAYQPNDLALDEMRAYADDLSSAAQALKKDCKKANTQAWAAIRAERLAGKPALPNLTGCDALFDQVVAKSVFGKNHTAPAIPALEALGFVAIMLEATGDNPEIILRGTAKMPAQDGQVKDELFELHLPTLAPRTSPDTKPEVAALLSQAKAHQTLWQKTDELTDKLTRAKPKELSGLLDTLVKRTKPPLVTPAL